MSGRLGKIGDEGVVQSMFTVSRAALMMGDQEFVMKRFGTVLLTMWLFLILALPLGAQPTTQSQARDVAKVLLLPLAPIDASQAKDWIGRGVMRVMEADLSRLDTLQPVTIDMGKSENVPP